jgi:ribonuclease-3
VRPAGADELARAIGHDFADPGLLRAALTHASAGAGTGPAAYQRLEFLGDRVLGLIIADTLYRRHRGADEGELALRFNSLVRRETLAGIAREISLGRHLVLGAGEAQAGGRDKDAILADTLEALLGAVYLDGGLDPVRALVERCWSGRIEAQLSAPRDPKTVLQEWSQGKGWGLPDYVEVARSGPDHAPVFTVEVRIEGAAPARGEGASKREAERNAASALIERELGRR